MATEVRKGRRARRARSRTSLVVLSVGRWTSCRATATHQVATRMPGDAVSTIFVRRQARASPNGDRRVPVAGLVRSLDLEHR
jgi:hypothetical protein